MRDMLTAWGSFALTHLAAPLVLWTAAALAVEAVLRATRVHAAWRLPVRSALVAALPVLLVLPLVLRAWVPPALVLPGAWAVPREIWLPTIVVGAPEQAEALPGTGLLVAGGLLLVAALAGGLSIVRLAVAYARLHRLAWPDAPPRVQAQAAEALAAAGVSRPVRVVTGGHVPLTFGARRPVIAVPDGLAGDALALALAHEAAHVRAGDFARHAVLSALAAPVAAHPLVGWLVRATALDREELADAAVLARRPDAQRAYGHLLASFAEFAAPRLALGATPGASPLLHRLTAMRHLPSPARLRTASRAGRAASMLLLLALGTVGVTSAAPADAQPATISPPSPQLRAEVDAVAAELDRRLDALQDETTPTADVRVSGRVVDALTGAPLAGANVGALPDAAGQPPAGAATGADGAFRLTAPDGTDAVRVTRAGYAPRALRLRGATTDLTIELTALAAPAEPDVYDVVDQAPELIGGFESLMEQIVYPEAARADGVEGTVFVAFVVDEAGVPTQIEVRRSPDERLSAAAVAAVEAVRFVPGRQRGEAVKVRFVLPVRFALPAGGDRGEARRPHGVVRHAGVDLARLANGAEIRARLDALPAELARNGISFGEVRVTYLIAPDGTTSRFRVESGPRDLHEAAVDIARHLRTAPDARPGAPAEGFFTLWHAPG